MTPSAVSVADDGTILVGDAALARRTTHPHATATGFKRDMGTDIRHTLAGKSYRAAELSSLVLTALKKDAEVALGRSVNEAVITVPAYFDEAQRRDTRNAAEIAGLRADRIINEPTAAAMAYGVHQRDREFRAVVLDIGGGTFDVTILEVMEGVIEIQSSAGDSRLGGDDFVESLARVLSKRWDLPPPREASVSRARLLRACEKAKRDLTREECVPIALAAFEAPDGTRDLSASVRRGEAERAWSPLLDRMRAPIFRALRDAELTPHDIEEVLLVGGASRMPCVVNLASEIFGRLPMRDLPPDEAVVQGAAVQAALKARDAAVADVVVTDVAPFSMGIEVAESMNRRMMTGLFAPVLERGTVIPASQVKTFSTVQDDQRFIETGIYQGENSLCRDNRQLGTLLVTGLPSRPAGACSVDVRFTYDLNGLIEVEATVVETGHRTAVVIEGSPGRMTESEIAHARKAMARLKFHPREALPNANALARAEALFVELTGPAREDLGAYLARFRGALDTHDKAFIEACRNELIAIIRQLSGRV